MALLKHPMANRLWSYEQSVFRDALKATRKKAKLSQAELAARLGKPQSYVSKYESGERRLDYLEVRVICWQCGMTLSEFERVFSAQLAAAKDESK